MKRFTKYTFLLLAFLLMFNASDDNNDEKEYWGRTDAGQWVVKTLSDDTEGFTFGWELPEAKATKEAFEKDSFNPIALKSTSLPKNSFVHRIGTHSEDDYKLHIMSDDSIVYYGSTNGTVVFEDLIIPNKTKKDLIIIKTDPNNKILWHKQFGSNYESNINIFNLTSDLKGNLYVAGYYTRDNTFGNFELPNGAFYTGFVSKINPDGVVQWVRDFNSEDYSSVVSIVVDSKGDPIIQLLFNRSIEIDGKLYRSPIFGRGGTIERILKLDTKDGSTKWVSNITSSSTNFVWDIQVDQKDNIFITGRLTKKLTIGNRTIHSSGNQYNGDGYLLKIDSSGNYLSHISFPGPKDSYIVQVGFLSDNSPIIRAAFIQGLKYKNLDLSYNSTSNYSNGRCCFTYSGAYFIAKLDKDLNILWHKQISPQGGGIYDLNSGQDEDNMVIDADDNLYFNYRAQSSAYVGLFKHNIGNYALEGNYYPETENGNTIYYSKADIGVLKIDKFGNEIWLSNFEYDASYSICRAYSGDTCIYKDYRYGYISDMDINSKGELYIASIVRKPLTFEGLEYPVYGNRDTFIHKIVEVKD